MRSGSCGHAVNEPTCHSCPETPCLPKAHQQQHALRKANSLQGRSCLQAANFSKLSLARQVWLWMPSTVRTQAAVVAAVLVTAQHPLHARVDQISGHTEIVQAQLARSKVNAGNL